MSENPLVGTWRLNVEKSRFVPGPAHAQQTITFVEVENGLHVTTTIHNADGTTTDQHYTAYYDGKPYPMVNLNNTTHVAMHRISELEDERVDTNNGVLVGNRLRTVAADRQSYYVHGTGVNTRGQFYVHKMLYEKIVLIYKILPRAAWQAAQAAGVFKGAAIDLTDGYIHFSTAAQAQETASKHFRGQADLVVLEIEAASLGDALKWEPSRGGALFPHLYGALDVKHVRAVREAPLDAHGVPQISV